MEQHYAAMARQHLRDHRPVTYAELMRDPQAGEEYLTLLGEQIAAQMALIEQQLLDSAAVPTTWTQQQRETQAQAMAAEIVLGELLWLADEATEAEIGPSGAFEGWVEGAEPLVDDVAGLMIR
jgi:hypothetical protein